MENTLKLIISRKGTYVYESSEMIHGRTKKYLIEKYQYPVYLHYSPDMAGVYPMSYTWQLSVVEINEAGDIIHLEDRTARACKRRLQAPWKASVLNCLRGINSGESPWADDPLADDYEKIHLAWKNARNLSAAAPEMLELLEDIDGAFWEGELKASAKSYSLKFRVQKLVLKMLKSEGK